jgi:hypothetical protein
MRPVLFSGDALPISALAVSGFVRIELYGEFAAPRRACSTRTQGGPRQPLDRQFRYYKEALGLASPLSCNRRRPDYVTLGIPAKQPANARKPLLWERLSRSGTCHWPPRLCGAADFLPSLLQASPGRLIPFQGRFIGGGSCRVPAVLLLIGISVSWYITGTYPIAIRGPFEAVFVFRYLARQVIYVFCILEACWGG